MAFSTLSASSKREALLSAFKLHWVSSLHAASTSVERLSEKAGDFWKVPQPVKSSNEAMSARRQSLSVDTTPTRTSVFV
eukprot:15484927-Alexandrium_andersonii.AAC.1